MGYTLPGSPFPSPYCGIYLANMLAYDGGIFCPDLLRRGFIFARLIFSNGFNFSLSEYPFGFGLSLSLSLQAVHVLPDLLQMVGIICPFGGFIAGQIFAKMVTFCCACSTKKKRLRDPV